MKFYRHLKPIKAMTFDLDDTLYDNWPIIRTLEARMVEWLHHHHPISATVPLSWWQSHKQRLAECDPWLPNDVTQWRFQQIESGLVRLGYDEQQAHSAASSAIEEVLRLRSDFSVPEETHRVLTRLAAQMPLVAITNGNVDVERIGLSAYFTLTLKAGPDGYAKPHGEMFRKAAQYLALDAGSILHVGDHLNTDVQGAKASGFQACWFNDTAISPRQARHARVLPDVEINQLSDLLLLTD